MNSLASFIYWELVLVFCAALAALFGVLLFIKYKRFKTWKTARMEILKIEIQKINPGGRLHVAYQPFIEYSYQVNGTSYKSSNEDLSKPFFPSEQRARDYIKRFTSNSGLIVYYDPLDPSDSVFEKSGQLTFSIISMMISAFFLFVALAGLYYKR